MVRITTNVRYTMVFHSTMHAAGYRCDRLSLHHLLAEGFDLFLWIAACLTRVFAF